MDLKEMFETIVEDIDGTDPGLDVLFDFESLRRTKHEEFRLQEMKLFQSPRHAQESQLVRSSTYGQEFQLVQFPAHAQGIQIVLPPVDLKDKCVVHPLEQEEETLRLPSPTHVQEITGCRQAEDEEMLPLPSPTNVQEITDYLIAHELWQVPESILYEEPVETQCDLEACVGTNDAMDAAGEIDGIRTEEADVFDIFCAEETDVLNAGEIDIFRSEETDILNAEDGVEVKARRRGGRRHKGHFMKRPMAMTEVIEELKSYDLRENALRCLSGHLVERREQDPEFYRQAGFYLFHSCGTVAILLQEILFVYERFNAGDLNVRRSKRLANVLCLLQSIATNDEARLLFVKACIPNYLIPFILSECTDDVYENLRALSLSIIGIVCQAREKEVIKWALQSDIIEACFHALDIGSELSKVIAMTILDSILRVDEGLAAVCEPSGNLLPKFIKLCGDLVSVLAVIRGFSPRLLFLVVRSFILLCQNCRALELLKDELPPQLEDTTFRDVKMEYPLFSYLRHQLLLCIGKAKDYLPSVVPSPASQLSSGSSSKTRDDISSSISKKATNEAVVVYVTPMRPIDLNKRDWSARLLQS